MTTNPLIPQGDTATIIPGVGEFRSGDAPVVPFPTLPNSQQPRHHVGGVTVSREEGSFNPRASSAEPIPQQDFALRCVNTGPAFRGQYLADIYDIPAGAEVILPAEVVITFFGNASTRNWSPRRRDRDNEFNRLRVRYGAYDDQEKWESVKPRFEVYSTSTGERIYTVIDDPTGSMVHEANPTVATQTAVEQQIAHLQSQVAALSQLLDNTTTPPSPSSTTPPIPTAPVDPPVVTALDAPAATIPEDTPKRVSTGPRPNPQRITPPTASE